MIQIFRQLINIYYFWKVKKKYKLTNKLAQLFRKYFEVPNKIKTHPAKETNRPTEST